MGRIRREFAGSSQHVRGAHDGAGELVPGEAKATTNRLDVMQPTLLLNATYEPLMIIGWQRAIILVVLGKGDVLEEYARSVRSVRHDMHVPSVLRLRQRVRRCEPQVRFSRANIYSRDGYRCQYCGCRLPARELTYDHVHPRSRGGKTVWSNIVTCCSPCNRRKADKSLRESGMNVLSTPRRPRWRVRVGDALGLGFPESWGFYLGVM